MTPRRKPHCSLIRRGVSTPETGMEVHFMLYRDAKVAGREWVCQGEECEMKWGMEHVGTCWNHNMPRLPRVQFWVVASANQATWDHSCWPACFQRRSHRVPLEACDRSQHPIRHGSASVSRKNMGNDPAVEVDKSYARSSNCIKLLYTTKKVL